MTLSLFNTRAVLLSGLFLVTVLSGRTLHAADAELLHGSADAGLLHGSMVLAPAGQLDVMASGAVEDTLKACLGRIPVDASVGQRLLAEQSCTGDEETRKLLQAAPKF